MQKIIFKIAIISLIAQNKVWSAHQIWHDSRNSDVGSNLSTIDKIENLFEYKIQWLLEYGNSMTNLKLKVLKN